jgi:hypothetical protein
LSKPSAKAYGKARSLTNAVRDAIGAVTLPRAAEYKGRLATRPRESRSRVEGGDAGDSYFVRLYVRTNRFVKNHELGELHRRRFTRATDQPARDYDFRIVARRKRRAGELR